MSIDLHTPTAVQRLVRLFDSADADALHYGLTWYGTAHQHARAVASRLGLSVSHGAGVIAALSPRNPWSRNVEQAFDLAHDKPIEGLTLHVGRAERIANGEHPNDVLGGPKVRAFWSNITDPTTTTAVTIDVWATRALFPPDTDPKACERWLKRKASYARAEHVYRLAAAHRNVPAHVMQAVVWCVIRGSHN